MKKEKVFLGGSYFSPKEKRLQIIPYAERIEKAIISNGFKTSMNLLSNKDIFSGSDANAQEVKFSDGKFFYQIGEKILSTKKKEIEKIRALRHFNDEQSFILCCMADGIIFKEMSESVCAIMELSEKSAGAHIEIGTLLFRFNLPVLALSNENFGSDFNTVLVGMPSTLLITKKYNDDNLEKIINEFLIKDLASRKLKTISYKAPIYQDLRLKEACRKDNITISDLLRDLVDKYLEQK